LSATAGVPTVLTDGAQDGRALYARAEVRRKFAPGDAVAGISVAMVLIPQSLAYAQLAGMPAYRGLYAAAIPLLVQAFFVSSPYLQTGPVAITSLLTFGALSSLATPGSNHYVQLGLLLAVVVGVVRIVLGVLGAGVLAYLMSQPMLMGFIPAAAVLIAATQLPNVLGVHLPHKWGVIHAALWSLSNPTHWKLAAIILAAATLGIVLAGRRLNALFPGVLIAVAAGIAYVKLSGYHGGTVGHIPAHEPPISLKLPWNDLGKVLLPGAVIALVGFAEPSSIARTFAAIDRTRWSANREFVSQGISNVASGFTGGFPIGGSFSRSSLNRLAGARSRWSGGITGLCVLAFLPIATVLEPLPTAVLGAVVISAVLQLIARAKHPVALWKVSRPQALVAAGTFVLALWLQPHLERAVIIAVAASVGTHLWRELRTVVDKREDDDGRTLVLAPRGVLWFGDAQDLEDSFLDLLSERPAARALRIDLDGLGRIDVTGAMALRNVVQSARQAGLEVEVRGGPPQNRHFVEDVIERPRLPFGD
jgi:SulP family sulfate permease